MGPPSGQLLRLLYGGPLRSVSSLTIKDPLRSISSLTMWGPLRQISSHTIWPGPPQFSFFAYYRGPPQISFFACHMGAPSDQFLRILYGGPLRPVSSHTIWGPPSDQFLRLLNGGPFGQFLLHLLYGAPLNFFLKFYALNYSWGAPIFLNFQGGASAPSCPPLRAPMSSSITLKKVYKNRSAEERRQFSLLVSHERTWQKHRSSSLHALGVCIDVTTCLVIDYELILPTLLK